MVAISTYKTYACLILLSVEQEHGYNYFDDNYYIYIIYATFLWRDFHFTLVFFSLTWFSIIFPHFGDANTVCNRCIWWLILIRNHVLKTCTISRSYIPDFFEGEF